MNLLLDKIKREFPQFNRIPFTEKDFWRIVKRENIFVHFWNLSESVNGFYGVNRRYRFSRHYIVLNSKLLPNKWLFTGLHELIHFWLHAPRSHNEVYFSSRHVTRDQDKEADKLALIGIYPLPTLIEATQTPFEYLPVDTIEKLIRRKDIFDGDGV